MNHVRTNRIRGLLGGAAALALLSVGGCAYQDPYYASGGYDAGYGGTAYAAPGYGYPGGQGYYYDPGPGYYAGPSTSVYYYQGKAYRRDDRRGNDHNWRGNDRDRRDNDRNRGDWNRNNRRDSDNHWSGNRPDNRHDNRSNNSRSDWEKKHPIQAAAREGRNSRDWTPPPGSPGSRSYGVGR